MFASSTLLVEDDEFADAAPHERLEAALRRPPTPTTITLLKRMSA